MLDREIHIIIILDNIKKSFVAGKKDARNYIIFKKQK